MVICTIQKRGNTQTRQPVVFLLKNRECTELQPRRTKYFTLEIRPFFFETHKVRSEVLFQTLTRHSRLMRQCVMRQKTLSNYTVFSLKTKRCHSYNCVYFKRSKEKLHLLPQLRNSTITNNSKTSLQNSEPNRILKLEIFEDYMLFETKSVSKAQCYVVSQNFSFQIHVVFFL